jgi:hypothetical protein
MIRLYATTHTELMNSLKTEEEKSSEEFREQRRRKRNASDEHPTAPKKLVPATIPEITTTNFFAPLRTARMDTDATTTYVVSTQRGGGCWEDR